MIPEFLADGEVLANVVLVAAAWSVILTALVIVFVIGHRR